MAATPSRKFDSVIESLDKFVENGEVAPEDADAIRELCAAYDPEDATANPPRDLYEGRRADGHKKYGTLAAWANRLTVAARGVTLTDTTSDDINRFTTELIKTDDGPGTARVQSIEYALSKLYRYHDDLGIDPRDITIHQYDGDRADWDARDMLDPDERAAMRAVADHPRDLAIYHLALYCGLRNTAIRTLRIRDIDLPNHEWHFNTDADGLKDIHQPRKPRPLFQAERAVRNWIDYHPTGDPDHYLITGKPKYANIDPTTPVSHETIRRAIQGLKDATANIDSVVTVDKPCHPHMMRHNFVSMCRRHPDITDADIKFYLGHAPGSNVMETTYSHLAAEDHNERGHAAMGTNAAAHGSGDIDPWDTTCDHCDRVLAPTEDVCSACDAPRGRTPWDVPQDRARAVIEDDAEMFKQFTRAMFEGIEEEIDRQDVEVDLDKVLNRGIEAQAEALESKIETG